MLGKSDVGLLGFTFGAWRMGGREPADSVPGVWTLWETGTFPVISVHQTLFSTYMLVSGHPAVTGTHRGL